MCGRFTDGSDTEKIAKKLKVPKEKIPPRRKRYNVAPSQPVLTLFGSTNKRKIFDYFQWGLVPSWARDPAIGSRMINARAETVSEKPSFKGLLRNSRCLIVADGYYEWKREGAKKQPYYFRMKDQEPFTFAGLWSHWINVDGSEIKSCTIITTKANSLTQSIHDRMPVILAEEKHDFWLDSNNYKSNDLLPLLRPYSSDAMESYPVSTEVNSPQNDSPENVIANLS